MTEGALAQEIERYTFENETTRYEVETNSENGRLFQGISSGPEKIEFLKANGQTITKETCDRIMIPEPGAWRFFNDGQIEYMFRADTSSNTESPLEQQIKKIEELDEKKAFFFMNATRIREWPERIQRKQNLIE